MPHDRRTATPEGVIGPSKVVGSSVRCVITRMRFRWPWHLVLAYRAYRHVGRAACKRRPPGLLKAVLLVEDSRTCYSMSLWDGEPRFSASVPEHIHVVNRIFGLLAADDAGGPELWSTTWRLDAISHNQRWGDLDLLSRIGEDGLRFDGSPSNGRRTHQLQADGRRQDDP